MIKNYKKIITTEETIKYGVFTYDEFIEALQNLKEKNFPLENIRLLHYTEKHDQPWKEDRNEDEPIVQIKAIIYEEKKQNEE